MKECICRGCAMVALLALGSIHLACDRTKLSKPGDAAVPDVGGRDVVLADQVASSPDLTDRDQLGADQVGADLPAGQPSADAVGATEVATSGDTSRSDLARSGDASALEVPASARDAAGTKDAGADTVGADVPAGDAVKADLSPGDVARADLPASDGLRDSTVSPGDGPAEGPRPCVPGGGGCNDDPRVSSIWGTCQPDGTCVCNTGFVINPATGRCRLPPQDASGTGDGGEAACTGEATACGCGCCGGSPSNLACYYPTLGETTSAIKAQDDAVASSPSCASSGCSAGTRYVCCVPAAPDPTSNATYSSDSYIGDLDHVGISKSGADCAQVSLSSPATSRANLRIDTPSSWGVTSAAFGSCGDAGDLNLAVGALGTVALRASGTDCLADMHVTLFAFTSANEVKTTRLDVDGLVVKNFPASMCK